MDSIEDRGRNPEVKQGGEDQGEIRAWKKSLCYVTVNQELIPKVGGVRERDWSVLSNISKVINEGNKNENILLTTRKRRRKKVIKFSSFFDRNCLKVKIVM